MRARYSYSSAKKSERTGAGSRSELGMRGRLEQCTVREGAGIAISNQEHIVHLRPANSRTRSGLGRKAEQVVWPSTAKEE